ncbi:MAG TPA: right-handed parallel beta-helix repeat-containing protein [Rhizomicrobium sp.]|nr:right-handed parallel beta-helix repeat-containing protein [Rhizomicrobium sp.]
MRIFSDKNNFASGSSALLTTGDYCRITGLAIDANNALSGMLDAVDIGGTHNSIDGRALIENGYHNVNCGTVQVDGLQLKDAEFIGSGADNIYLPGHCGNVRMTGDLVESSGTNGVYFGGDDLTISGGVIEESPGNGLDIESAHEVTACETYYDIDGNQTAGAAAIRIANSTTVAICGNHFQRSGGDAAGSAHIVFSGKDSNITFSGNVYRTNSSNGDPNVRPWYVYDAETGTTLVNSHFYENPRPGRRRLVAERRGSRPAGLAGAADRTQQLCRTDAVGLQPDHTLPNRAHLCGRSSGRRRATVSILL